MTATDTGTDIEQPPPADIEPGGVPGDVDHRPGRPAAPAVGYDLLGGTGRTAWRTRKLNRTLAGIAATAVLAVAATVGWQWQQRNSAAEQLAATVADIDRLDRELSAATDTVLSEADLATHVTGRRDLAMAAAGNELPYRYVLTSLLATASDLGLNVGGIEFRGADVSNGVTITGTANGLAVLGEWNSTLQSTYGAAVDGGFVDELSTTYRSLAGADLEAFTTTMRVTVAGVQRQASCTRLSPFLDGPLDECDGVGQLALPGLPEVVAPAADAAAAEADQPDLDDDSAPAPGQVDTDEPIDLDANSTADGDL